MDKLDEAIIMNEAFLDKLNKNIDNIMREKQKYKIDYDMLEKVLEATVKNQRYRRTSSVDKLIPIKKERILAIALDFFKSIDNEFYQEAVKVILGQRDRTKIGIYNIHKVKNFKEKDENGMRMYKTGGSVDTYRGNSYAHIPLQKSLKSSEAKILAEDEGTLEDLYTVVHEITHFFSLNKTDTLPTKEELISDRKYKLSRKITQELLVETPTIAFEILLTDYLLKKRSFPEVAVKDKAHQRTNWFFYDTGITLTKLILAKEKSKNGKITLEYIEDMMKKEDMSVQDVRTMARDIIDDNSGLFFRNRYAVGALVAPTLVKAYENNKTEGVKSIKKYLKAVHDDDFSGALNALGIELNGKGINTLVKNMKVCDAKINEDKER